MARHSGQEKPWPMGCGCWAQGSREEGTEPSGPAGGTAVLSTTLYIQDAGVTFLLLILLLNL